MTLLCPGRDAACRRHGASQIRGRDGRRSLHPGPTRGGGGASAPDRRRTAARCGASGARRSSRLPRTAAMFRIGRLIKRRTVHPWIPARPSLRAGRPGNARGDVRGSSDDPKTRHVLRTVPRPSAGTAGAQSRGPGPHDRRRLFAPSWPGFVMAGLGPGHPRLWRSSQDVDARDKRRRDGEERPAPTASFPNVMRPAASTGVPEPRCGAARCGNATPWVLRDKLLFSFPVCRWKELLQR